MNYRFYLASLLVFITGLFCAQSVSVLYFTDAHEIAPFPYSKGTKGGVARLKTLVDELKTKDKSLVVTFGGDLAGGTLFGKVYKGFPMIETLNMIPLDIANFGQHEFDFGVENAKKLVDKSKFQWFSSNITDAKGNPFHQLPTYLIKDENGIKIGFIGLTDDINTSAQGEDLAQQNMIFSGKKAVSKLREQQVEYIIAITQMSISENRKILEAIPEIDLIFTEEVSEETTEIISFEDKYIVSTIGYMGSVAEVELTKYEGKIESNIRIHFLGDQVRSEEKLNELSQQYMANLEKSLAEKISFAKDKFSIENHVQRQEENALGNLIADAYKDYFSADIGLMNGGGIRNGLPQGEISIKDIYAVLPFDNKVCLASVSGKKIKEMLEQGLINWKKLGGEFLQVSGLEYSFRVSKESKVQLLSVKFEGKQLEESKKYTVAMPNYVLLGGGTFEEIPKNQILVDAPKAPIDSDVLVKYLKKTKELESSKENRIIILK